jgi:hypothetical protein
MTDLRWVFVFTLCGLYGCGDKEAGNAAWCNQLLVDACACESTDDDSDLCQDADAVAGSDDDAACRSYYYASVPAECQTVDDGDSGSDEEATDEQTDAIPTGVEGQYSTQVDSVTGCAGESHWIEDTVPGPMNVDVVDSERLRFVVSGDLSLSGSVVGLSYTVTGNWAVASEEDGVGGADLDVSISGVLESQSNGCWVIDGDVEMVVDQDGLEATNCQLSATMTAYQLRGEDCESSPALY